MVSSPGGATAPTGGPVQPATCVCSSCLAARVNRLGRGVVFQGCLLLLLLVLCVVFLVGGGGGGSC